MPHNLANPALGLSASHAVPTDSKVPHSGTVKALVDSGVWSDGITWLAPLAHSLVPGTQNELVVLFDQPVTVSMIKVGRCHS